MFKEATAIAVNRYCTKELDKCIGVIVPRVVK